MGNFCVKKVTIKEGIPPSISEETIRRFLQKAGMIWTPVQRKIILTKNDLKLVVKFARVVPHKLSANFWEEGAGFYLDGASFTYKRTLFTKPKLQGLWPGEILDKDLTLASLEKEVTGRKCCLLYGSNCILKRCNCSRTVTW